jgi:carboxyl-terminal processing protease
MPFRGQRGWLQVASLVAMLALGLVGGVAIDQIAMAALRTPDAGPNFRLIDQAWSLIRQHYVDRAAEQPRGLTYGAISGMVNSLGDTGHTRFLSPGMVREMSELERNKYQGIGAEVGLKAGRVVIVAPFDGSPAQRAGLKSGDVILRVNGQGIMGLPLDQVVGMISGPAGTRVTLTVLSPTSGRTREVTLTRAVIKIQDVSWRMLPGTGVADVRIANFDGEAAAQLRQALTAIRQKSPTGLILDLRNNPGGLLSQAIDIASQFLKSGNVLIVKNAAGKEQNVAVKRGGEATKIPLVVLVNYGTASAAEIVAGALQDANRARLVGETTFGTGTVLREFKLSDGSALLLAVEEWLTPDGHVIWHKGITPNVVVQLPVGATPLSPAMAQGMTAEQLLRSGDTQLLRALELLRNPATSNHGRAAELRGLARPENFRSAGK